MCVSVHVREIKREEERSQSVKFQLNQILSLDLYHEITRKQSLEFGGFEKVVFSVDAVIHICVIWKTAHFCLCTRVCVLVEAQSLFKICICCIIWKNAYVASYGNIHFCLCTRVCVQVEEQSLLKISICCIIWKNTNFSCVCLCECAYMYVCVPTFKTQFHTKICQ